MAEPQVVKFEAEMRQIRSMSDGTFNLVLNIPEYQLTETQTMMAWLKGQVDVAIVFAPIILAKLDYETEKETAKRTTRVGRRRS